MKKVVIFSGTTEGRMLSSALARRKLQHVVCVASEYGKEMMEDSPFALLHVGRMDADEMAGYLRGCFEGEDGTVVDATHPYATEVTENIKRAAGTLGLTYIRVVRGKSGMTGKDASIYTDIADCATALEETEGNILLTTGSKELHKYCETVSAETRRRTYVRVLPTVESLEMCMSEGIEGDHIIAMHGPFTRECNEAVLRQYAIRHLVTKDSGTAGGFEAKAEAARNVSVRLHVIKRPVEEEGVGVEEAERLLLSDCPLPDEKEEMMISVVGIGMGSRACRTLEAEDAIRSADAVFGAKRLLESLEDIPAERKYGMYRAEEIIPVLEREDFTHAVILYSGDSGFYSGAKRMVHALKAWRSRLSVRVLPGISSVAYLAAKLGESYENAVLFSLHGKNEETDYGALVREVQYHEKVFSLLSGGRDVSEVAKRLMEAGLQGTVFVGADLSYDTERIEELSFEEAASYGAEGIPTVLIRNRAPERRPLLPVKRDTEFLRSKVPMTKECVRHESILRLEPREGDVLYDIGGGTGSVAIEAAALHPSLKVYTMERKTEAASLIRENLKAAGTGNVTVLEGEATALIKELPKPDAVFIGGSGGRLREILELLTSKGTGIRYVINAVSMETMGEVQKLLESYKTSDERTIMLSVSEVNQVGAYHMLQGQNPVWIFSFTI